MFDVVLHFHSFETMSRCACVLVLLCILSLQILTTECRSIPKENSVTSILNDPFSDDHRKLLHAFTGYRHRFEQSSNFKTLRWALGNLQADGVCDLCILGAPLVSSLIGFCFSK